MGPRVAHKAPRATAMKMAFEQEIGAQPPLGFWDPLGLLENADQDRFDRLREVGPPSRLTSSGRTPA